MCAQCMMGAAVATSGVTGVRAFLSGRVPERTLRRIWIGLAAAAVLGSGVLFSGSA